jgi:type VI protein secretion system component Hcp
MADTLIYLKIAGDDAKAPPLIKGESNAAGYKDLIELESVEWSVAVPARRGNDTDKAEQPQFKQVTLEKFFDGSTCALLKYAKTKKRSKSPDAIRHMEITYVDMVLDKTGTNQAVPVVEIKLHSCYLDSVALTFNNAGKGVQLTETIVVSYQSLDLTYHPAGKERLQRGEAMSFQGAAAGLIKP